MAPNNDPFRKDKKLESKYANYFAVGYNAHEFIFDFGKNYSEKNQAELCSRIITSPIHVKKYYSPSKNPSDNTKKHSVTSAKITNEFFFKLKQT